jgi:hypothetical protein
VRGDEEADDDPHQKDKDDHDDEVPPMHSDVF